MSGLDAYNIVVSSVVLASIYTLVTLGYVVVYRASRVFNFLHPQFMLLGALIFTVVARPGSPGFAFALVVATILVSLISGAVYMLVVNRTTGQPHWIQMILTMGLGIVFLNLAELFWGPAPRYISLPVPRGTLHLPGGAVLSTGDVTILGVAVVLNAVLFVVLTKSPVALRLQTIAEDARLAAYCGIRLGLWLCVAWALAAAAAVSAGIFYGSRVTVDPNLADVGLLAFPAAMIGGMDSIGGAAVGAVILALLQQFSARLWGSDVSAPLAFLAVLVIFIARPRGLFGGALAERV